jgi:hypothetical protein
MTNRFPHYDFGFRASPMHFESRFVFAKNKNTDLIRSRPVYSMALNALANSLSLWAKESETELNPKTRLEYKNRVDRGNAYLERINKPIQSPSDLDNALSEWERLSNVILRLESQDAGNTSLIEVLDSDFSAFLDSKTLSQIEIARERVAQADRVEGVLGYSSMQKLRELARTKWDKEIMGKLPHAISSLSDADTREWYQGKIDEKGADTLQAEWAERNLERVEKEARKTKGYSDRIPHDSVEKIQTLANEANGILLGQMADYLKGKADLVKTEAEILIKRWGSELAPDTASDVLKRIENARNYADTEIRDFNPTRSTPTESRFELQSKIEDFEVQANASINEIRNLGEALLDYSQHKTETIQLLKNRESLVLTFLKKSAEPNSIDIIQDSLESQRTLEKSIDPTLRDGRYDLGANLIKRDLLDPKAPWKSKINETADLDGLTGEEILARKSALDLVAEPFVASEKAHAAREAMEIIKRPGTPRQILERLSESVGADHVERVSSKSFEKKYRRYTTTGSMVFYQKGDFWKIIVDESRIDEPNSGDFLKDQLAHELRHLEFESDPRLNEAWKTAFTRQLGTEDWKSIKEAFVSQYPDKTPSDYKGKKTRFSADDWTNDDILSELYAMEPDWSFLPPSAHKAKRLAEFKLNDETRVKWESALFGQVNAEKWIGVREAMRDAFPHRLNAEGIGMGEWDDADALAELYSMTPHDFESHPALQSVLWAAGLNQWLTGADSQSKSYAEFSQEPEQEARILGAEKKGKDEEEIVISEEDLSKSDLERRLNSIIKDIEEVYEPSPFLSQIPGAVGLLSELKKHAENTKEKLGELDKQKNLKEAHKAIESLTEHLEAGPKSIKSAIMEISEKEANPRTNPLLKLYDNTYVYSFKDFAAVFENAKEYFGRYFKRQAGIHKGNLSKIIFENVNEGLALSSSSFISTAWKEEIQAWEERLKSKNSSKLYEYLEEQSHNKLPDKSLVVAVVNVLCEKGAMDWKNKDFLICLNNLQTSKKFDVENDKMLFENENYLRDKLKVAMAQPATWNKETAFGDRERTNTSAYDDRKSKAKPVIESAIRLIGPRLKKMLDDKRNSKKTKKPVDPAEYEEMLDLSIENGFSDPEEAMFYLWSGMACGLLKPNTGSKLARHFSIFPVMDYFNDVGGELTTSEKIEEFVKSKFGNDYKNNNIGSEFREFYWTEMLNNPRIRSRAQQKVPTGGNGWDHDWSKSFAMCGDAEIARTILKGSGGAPITQLTKLPNIYAGIYQFFDQNSEEKLKKIPSKKILVDAIGYYFMWESILCGAAYSKDATYRRGSSVDPSTKPHAGGPAKHPDMNMGQMESGLNTLMKRINPKLTQLFALATDPSGAANPDAHLALLKKTLLAAMPGEATFINGINSLDNFYDRLQTIISKVLDGVSAGDLSAAIRSGLPK